MSLVDGIFTGLAGGLKLYSGVRSLFGEDYKAAERELRKQRDAEQAWYKRNYYNDYLNSSMAQAAMKRVRDTLSRNSRQNRAYAVISGATPEYALAGNEQGLRTIDNMYSNLASQESNRRASVDARHLQNLSSLNNRRFSLEMNKNRGIDPDLIGGLSLLNKAIDGVNWGRESGNEKDTKMEG